MNNNKKMNKNLSSLNCSISFFNRNYNYRQFETTYKSTYGSFYQGNNNSKQNCKCTKNNNLYMNNRYLFLNQTSKEIPNSKLICPNCINQNISKIKSLSRSRIQRKIIIDGFFEDKMKSIHNNKMQKDIQNREERAKRTYTSLFNNRGRSEKNYKKIVDRNNDDIYFGKDIDYGMIRCRNRELKINNKLFGIDLNKSLKNNKSWVGRNYLLDKKEYGQIINTQIKKKNKKNMKERNLKLKEENKILNEQLQNEKNKIKDEKNNKNNIRNEMNKANNSLLIAKKHRENNEKRIKRKEKEFISNICQKEIEEFKNNLKMKKLKNQNVDKDNYKISQIKNKNEKYNKLNNNKIYYGLLLKGVENKKCNQCNREYPKNVLSQIVYSYNEQQKK